MTSENLLIRDTHTAMSVRQGMGWDVWMGRHG